MTKKNEEKIVVPVVHTIPVTVSKPQETLDNVKV